MSEMSTTSNLIGDFLESLADFDLIIGWSSTSSKGFAPLFELLRRLEVP